MKKRRSLIWITMILAIGCIACQPTPEQPVVVNKNDGKLEAIIAQTDDQEQISDIPTTMVGGLVSQDNYLTVNIDADVIVPSVQGYPVIAIEPLDITQEMADRILETLIGDNVLYCESDERTTDEITREIQLTYQYITEELALYEESDPDYYDRKYKDCIEWIKYLNELLPNSTNERGIHSKRFSYRDEDELKNDEEGLRQSLEELGRSDDEITDMLAAYSSQVSQEQSICGDIDMGKVHMASIDIHKLSLKQQSITYYNTDSGGAIGNDFELCSEGMGDAPQITQDEAIGVAQDVLTRMGLEEMSLYQAGFMPNYDEAEILSGYAYKLIFARNLYQVPVTYAINLGVTNGTAVYREPWVAETLILSVDDTGIIGFQWRNPIEVKETVNSSVEILPFDEIEEIFQSHIILNHINEGNVESKTISIDRVTLGLVKIARKDTDEYMLVPAWDFFGTSTERYEGDAEYHDLRYGMSFLTINAIDGTIIDRAQGY